MTDQATRPFLINKDTEGNFRLTVRDIRYNSQGYPLVSGVLQEECFKTALAACGPKPAAETKTAAAAKTWARDHFNAKAGQYATK